MVDISKIGGPGTIQPGKNKAANRTDVNYDNLINSKAQGMNKGETNAANRTQMANIGMDPRFAAMKTDPKIALADEISLVMGAGSTEASSETSRAARIEKLRAMIQDGTYDVKPEKVAESILRRGTFF